MRIKIQDVNGREIEIEAESIQLIKGILNLLEESIKKIYGFKK